MNIRWKRPGRKYARVPRVRRLSFEALETRTLLTAGGPPTPEVPEFVRYSPTTPQLLWTNPLNWVTLGGYAVRSAPGTGSTSIIQGEGLQVNVNTASSIGSLEVINPPTEEATVNSIVPTTTMDKITVNNGSLLLTSSLRGAISNANGIVVNGQITLMPPAASRPTLTVKPDEPSGQTVELRGQTGI